MSSKPNKPRPFFIDALHVFVLGNFAVAQPLYDLLGQHAEYFVARNTHPEDLAALVLGLSLVLPSVFPCILALARLPGCRVYSLVYTPVLLGLTSIIALPAINQIAGPSSTLVVGLSILIGLAFALAYHRLATLRSFVTALSPAILLFPAVFLLMTPVSKVAFPQSSLITKAPTFTSDAQIVILVFDMLPVTALMDEEHNIDVKKYPNFARLAHQSHWYRQATTVAPSTSYAVPALLTGRYPQQGKLPVLEDYPDNLFTLLGASIPLNVFESGTRLCPADLCGESIHDLDLKTRWVQLFKDTYIVYLHTVLPEALSKNLPPVDAQWHNFEQTPKPQKAKKEVTAETEKHNRARRRKELKKTIAQDLWQDRIESFKRFLNRLDNLQNPTLSYLHLMLPHGPFNLLPSGKEYVPDEKKYRKLRLYTPLGKVKQKLGTKWKNDEYLVKLAYQRLLFQIIFADTLLGQLLDRLNHLETYDRSLIIVVADHGQSYNPGELLRNEVDGDTIHVPVFIKLPYQEKGVIDDSNVELIDVLPTIADALGIDLPWYYDGQSLMEDHRLKRAKKRLISSRLGTIELDWPNNMLTKSVQQKLARTESGDTVHALFRIGPYSELVGQPLSQFSQKTTTKGEIEIDDGKKFKIRLDQAEFFQNIDPDSDFLPSYMTGSIETDADRTVPLALAVAVNDVIQATCRTYEDDEQTMFAAMVPELAFRSGENSWGIYVIDVDGRGRMNLVPDWPHLP